MLCREVFGSSPLHEVDGLLCLGGLGRDTRLQLAFLEVLGLLFLSLLVRRVSVAAKECLAVGSLYSASFIVSMSSSVTGPK